MLSNEPSTIGEIMLIIAFLVLVVLFAAGFVGTVIVEPMSQNYLAARTNYRQNLIENP